MSSLLNNLRRNTNSLNYIPAVDGIRFIAIALVILQHLSERIVKYNSLAIPNAGMEEFSSYLISRGTIGVFIFFALSGFIIALPFTSTSSFNLKDYRSYIIRRLTRLEPTYIIWMLAFAIILGIKSAWPPDLFAHLISSLTYSHNIVYTDYSIINPVAWSLEVEIQYYLIAPFLVIAYFRIPTFLIRSSLFFTSLLLYLVIQHHLGWQLLPIRASILGQFQHFMVGIWIADIYRSTSFFERKQIIWDLIGIISLISMAFNWTEQLALNLIFQGSMILLFIAFFKGKTFNQTLSLNWISAIGGMCYTIYLIHLPLLEGITSSIYHIIQPKGYLANLLILSCVAIPLILAISIPAYLLLEKPFMKKDWWKNLELRSFSLKHKIQAK